MCAIIQIKRLSRRKNCVGWQESKRMLYICFYFEFCRLALGTGKTTGKTTNAMATVEVEVYHVWWEFDSFPPLSLLTFPHHGGILSWWEYAG